MADPLRCSGQAPALLGLALLPSVGSDTPGLGGGYKAGVPNSGLRQIEPGGSTSGSLNVIRHAALNNF